MWPTTGIRAPNRSDARLCRVGRISKRSRSPGSRSDGAPKVGDERPLLCAICRSVVTEPAQAIEINGRHEHAFFNPAGIAYELRCFRQAPGANIQNKPTAEFSWFAGYLWQIAVCTACGAHLGWRFTGPSSFYGLIGAKLI